MDRLITEKATSFWDLPHDYRDLHGTCYCGRRQSNTLHLPSQPEHASAATRVVTEKGS